MVPPSIRSGERQALKRCALLVPLGLWALISARPALGGQVAARRGLQEELAAELTAASRNGSGCGDLAATEWQAQCTLCLDENDTSCLVAALAEPDATPGCPNVTNVTNITTYVAANLGEVCTCVNASRVSDPCIAPLALSDGDHIDFLGTYGDFSNCEWTLECASNASMLTFTSFSTEADYDFVYVDGVEFHGSEIPDPVGGGAFMSIQFESDLSVQDEGFSADVACVDGLGNPDSNPGIGRRRAQAAAPPPPPPPPPDGPETYESQTECEENTGNLADGPFYWICEPVPCGNNTCASANNLECEEGSAAGGALCDIGTDCADCGSCCEIPSCGDDTCPIDPQLGVLVDNGQCDDGSTGEQVLCALGTDCTDCGSCCPIPQPFMDPECVNQCVDLFDSMFCQAAATGTFTLAEDYTIISGDRLGYMSDCELWLNELITLPSAVAKVEDVEPGSVVVTFSVQSSAALSSMANTSDPGTAALDEMQSALAGGATFGSATVVDFAAGTCSPGYSVNPIGFYVPCDSAAESCPAGCIYTSGVAEIQCELSSANDCPAGCEVTSEIPAEPAVASCDETAAVSAPPDADACQSWQSWQDGTACLSITTAANASIAACTYSAVGSTTSYTAATCGSNIPETPATCTGTSTTVDPAGNSCDPCAPGFFGDGSADTCTPCPAGQFSEGSADSCADCEPGQYAAGEANVACVNCNAGQYAEDAGRSYCDVCLNGTVLTATGSSTADECVECIAGRSSSEPTVECTDCTPGRYAEATGSAACDECNLGRVLTFTAASSMDECEDCSPGKSSADPSTECVECVPGRYADSPGAASCTNCTAGRVLLAPNGSSVDDCVDCVPGQSSSVPTANCTMCVPGQYAGSAGADTCTICQPGQYVGSIGADTCIDCEQGQYATSTGAVNCETCVPGQYAGSGADICIDCEQGQYTNANASASCQLCPEGRYALDQGFRSCEWCPSGYTGIAGITDSSNCTACTLGRFSELKTPDGDPVTVQDTVRVGVLLTAAYTQECSMCDPGRSTNDRTAQSDCVICSQGRYAKGAGNQNCTDCPIGKYTTSQQATKDECVHCAPGRGFGYRCNDPPCDPLPANQAENLDGKFQNDPSDEVCSECQIGFYFLGDPLSADGKEDPEHSDADGAWIPPSLSDPEPHSCRRCAAGRHTKSAGSAEVDIDANGVPGYACTVCGADQSFVNPPQYDNAETKPAYQPAEPEAGFICESGGCRAGHVDTERSLCAACVDIDTDKAEGDCENDGAKGAEDESCSSGFANAAGTACYRTTCGYFRRGTACEECSNPLLVAGLGLAGLTVSTTILTYAIVKGFSSDDVGRAELAKGGMDITKAMTSTAGMLQRLTCILTLPFGWPAWLVKLCYKLKGIVSFDLPGLAAPECQQTQTAAEMQLTRLSISAAALPVIWSFIFVEMIVIRNCTKLGKRKAARGTSLFGCTLLGFGRCGCPEGAFQSVVITMHGLFFLSVIQSAFGALYCVEGTEKDANGDPRMYLASNPSVYCEVEPGENWTEYDASVYLLIRTLAYNMILLYGFIMSFFHWDVRVEYVGIWNKAFVSAIVIFYSRASDATAALVALSAVSAVFGFMGNYWRRALGNDGDDSNDAEEDSFFVMEVGAYCELMTYAFGLTLVHGYEVSPGQVGIEIEWYQWGNVAAYTILFVMTVYTLWTFKLGVQDEIAARRAEKAAVAHILFREMDADGSGKLDFNEVHALCERLGEKKSDAEVTKALKQMDKDGSMEADADEFVEWWVHYGGRKVPIPDELMDLADAAGGRSPPRGNPFHSTEDFKIDDEVRWFKEDEDVPKGSIGHIVGYKPAKGGGWKTGDLGLGPQVVVNDRVYVAWPHGAYFAHDPNELLLFSGKRTVPVGANWRGVFPKSERDEDYDAQVDEANTAEANADRANTGTDAAEVIGEAEKPVYDGPMEDVDVQMDFILGDHVVAREDCEVPGIPKGEIGAVTGFTEKLIVKVLFASSKDDFEVQPKDLKLEVAHVDNSIVEQWKHLTVTHAQLAVEQTQADEDHEALLKELLEMNEKQLKKRLGKLYPGTDAAKIDKTRGNGVDDRLEDEKKSAWRKRIYYEHSWEIAEQEKAEADATLAKMMAETAEQKEKVRIEYEHLTHKSAVGVHEARIVHAEKMHEQVTQEHAKTLKNVKTRKHWTLRASKARKKTDQVMREEAAERGIDTAGMKKKHVKKAVIDHQQQDGERRKQQHVDKIEVERQRHSERTAEHDGFVSKHGIEATEPGSVNGLVTSFENDTESSDGAQKSEEPSRSKKKGGKKKGKASQFPREEEFDNPLADDSTRSES